MTITLLDVFNEDFTREIRNARNHPEAYDKATEKFEQRHGFRAFNSYDSFRMKKNRKHNKK